MNISKYCHGTNHYHLVRLYDEMVTLKLVPEGLSATCFVDITFKCIDGNGELLDCYGIIGADVNPAQYSEVIADGSAPITGLVLTDPLFFSPSKYLRIEFD